MKEIQVRYCAVCGKEIRRRRFYRPEGRNVCGPECKGVLQFENAPSFEDRFWAKVDKSNGPDGCWIWTGALARAGYGIIGFSAEKHISAHRAAWEITNGPIPDGLLACHRCDNPRCVNPSHLFLGTAKDNAQDMVSKGRSSHKVCFLGEDHPGHKLTADAVRKIRQEYTSGFSMKFLASKYGTSDSNVWFIVNGKTWRAVL